MSFVIYLFCIVKYYIHYVDHRIKLEDSENWQLWMLILYYFLEMWNSLLPLIEVYLKRNCIGIQIYARVGIKRI